MKPENNRMLDITLTNPTKTEIIRMQFPEPTRKIWSFLAMRTERFLQSFRICPQIADSRDYRLDHLESGWKAIERMADTKSDQWCEITFAEAGHALALFTATNSHLSSSLNPWKDELTAFFTLAAMVERFWI